MSPKSGHTPVSVPASRGLELTVTVSLLVWGHPQSLSLSALAFRVSVSAGRALSWVA